MDTGLDSTTRQITVAGQRIATTDVGEGRPIIFVHGNPDNRLSWGGQVDTLRSKYRCIAPDFPGFGDSQPPPPQFDFRPRGQISLWRGFVEQLQLSHKPMWVIHDFAGPWVLPYLAAHPEDAAGVLISNTPFHSTYRWHPWARIWQLPLVGELATALSIRPLFRWEMAKGDPALPLSYADEAHRHMHSNAKATVLRTYRAWADFSAALGGWDRKLRAALEHLPSKVVWGDLDPYIPSHLADLFGAPVTHVPDAGHWVYLSRPGLFRREVLSLAEECWPDKLDP